MTTDIPFLERSDYMLAGVRKYHCLDLAKVQTQQGRLFFLILAV